MKKYAHFYIVFLIILLAVFAVISFVSPGWVCQEKYTPAFWCGFFFVYLSFAVHFICALTALSTKDRQQAFYNFSFLRISYIGLISSFVIGGLFMLTSVVPLWLCILVCTIASASNAISLVKVRAAAQMVIQTEQNIAAKNSFIKGLTAEASSLNSYAKNEQTRALTQKVYEALRYSDPVSSDFVAESEQQIQEAFTRFSAAVMSDADTSDEAERLLYLIDSRNQKCKAFK